MKLGQRKLDTGVWRCEDGFLRILKMVNILSLIYARMDDGSLKCHAYLLDSYPTITHGAMLNALVSQRKYSTTTPCPSCP